MSISRDGKKGWDSTPTSKTGSPKVSSKNWIHRTTRPETFCVFFVNRDDFGMIEVNITDENKFMFAGVHLFC